MRGRRLKGWYNESLRHSLAARGIRTRYKERYIYPNEDLVPGEYTYFHFTTEDRLDDIIRYGLIPGARKRGDSPSGIFASSSPRGALMWYDFAKMEGVASRSPILLRIHGRDIDVDYDKPGSMWHEMGSSYVIRDRISPENIDVFMDGKWRSLR